VKNPFALRNLAALNPGDKLVIYHTGSEKDSRPTSSSVIHHSSAGRLSVIPLTDAQFEFLTGKQHQTPGAP